MTKAQDVFEKAMGLMDELSASGAADTADTKEYKDRTVPILNVLIGELYPYSATYNAPEDNSRGIARVISSISASIDLDDYICRTVMPYGLAAHLFLDENPSSASFFLERYQELKAGLARGLAKVSEEIEDVYGGFPHNEFGWW